MMNIRIWHWISNRKRLREENESLREKIKLLEKKEREMQCLNVNLKRENDMAIAVLNKKYAKRISNMERFAEGMKKKLEEKKQALEQADNSWLAAKREAKELRHRIAQMEMEDKNRQKKDR